MVGQWIPGARKSPSPSPSRIVYTTRDRKSPVGFSSNGVRFPTRRKWSWRTQRVNWAVSKLKEKHENPFFLAVGIYAPLYPNYCPQKYFDLYDPDKIQKPPHIELEKDLADLPEKILKMKTARSRILQKLQGLDAWEDAIHGYLACISYADAMMGRVIDALEDSPYADNTIVVFWSDHGYHLGEKGDWGKHTLWERTSNVPFI